jgi:hypothetical protein
MIGVSLAVNFPRVINFILAAMGKARGKKRFFVGLSKIFLPLGYSDYALADVVLVRSCSHEMQSTKYANQDTDDDAYDECQSV